MTERPIFFNAHVNAKLPIKPQKEMNTTVWYNCVK